MAHLQGMALASMNGGVHCLPCCHKVVSEQFASLTSSRVVEQPALVASGITDKNAFFDMRLQGIALISLYMHIGMLTIK
jgi:hypothetical protein